VRIDVVTTFPELFTPAAPGVLGVSMPARALAAGAMQVRATNIRDFATDKHQKTDDRPFGGGPGMVMMCQPLWDAVMHAESLDAGLAARRVYMSPQGVPLTQSLVEELASVPRLLIIAGHYEGVDERVIEKLAPLEVSIGDYVLSGGELGALVLIDAIARLMPGVLGHEESAVQDSFSIVDIPVKKKSRRELELERKAWAAAGGAGPSPGQEPAPAIPPLEADPPQTRSSAPSLHSPRLLDCPHYTKPREWMGMEVPAVLLSGDHQKIASWRLEQRVQRTQQRRPDLLDT
jgi:tRNA (guanine37-N1)-methyltransferase